MRDIGWPNELPDPTFGVDRSDEDKDRYLRALFRACHDGSLQENMKILHAEHARLMADIDLWHILKDCWIEERKLKGQRYDLNMQAWFGPDGERVWD